MRSDSVHMRRTLFRRTLFRRTLFLAALLVDHAYAWRPADRTAPPPPADLHCQSWCTDLLDFKFHEVDQKCLFEQFEVNFGESQWIKI